MFDPNLAHRELREFAARETRHPVKVKWAKSPNCWYPCWGGDCPRFTGRREHGLGLVMVRLRLISDGTMRVSVWGADDTGMERDFTDHVMARAVYAGLPAVITVKHLRSLGFVNS